ncbi:MAG TPA: ribosome recycling factor [Candidatus Saccharimonadales bacterium]|nr:ribosome recycling factor [Candidatus Saccharimonadales bacterium]
MVRPLVAAADPKMDKALEHFSEELKGLRTGRASTALVEGLMVESYGQKLPFKQVASINTPDARTIAITPWDRSVLPAIEKVIRETQSLGLNPNNDGATIRLNIPPLTEERRRDLVKALGDKAEACHIALRNIRHDVLGEVKKLEKDKQATQDDVKFAETELNKKIDQYRARIDLIEKAKAAEIMQV